MPRFQYVSPIPILSLTLFGAALPARAEQPLDTIIVTANRSAQPLERVGQQVTLLDGAELQRRQVANVLDLLRTVPGVSVARNGGPGGVAGVFIRGAESDQTVALVDGVKLNDPAAPGVGFNFGNLLIGNIERIEVLRGPSSVLWGSQAIGGVVNMITRAPTETLAFNARGEYGYRNTGQLVGNMSGKAGPLSASIGGGWFRTDGISAFSEARGGREGDGFESFGANANLNLALSDAISLDARGWLASSENGQDGFPPPSFSLADTADITRTRELVGYTGLNVALFEGAFRNRLGFAITDIRRRNLTPDALSFAADGRNERLEYQGILDFAQGWQATTGLERETSRLGTSSFGSAPDRAGAQIDSLYAQLLGTPVRGFTLTAGVRHDSHSRFGGATTLAGSGVLKLLQGTLLRASYSEGFKAPSLFQLFSNFGNQTLRPERSQGWDIGLNTRTADGKLEASATWFQRLSTDLIDFVSCPVPRTGFCTDRPFGTYDNVLRARSRGVELGLALRPTEALSVQANYTWLDARNRAAGTALFGRRLARRPEHSANLLADWRWRGGFSAGATFSLVGERFDNAANTRRLESYVLADLRAALPLSRQVELYGRIENLLGARYETATGYGQPGRAGYIGVRVQR